MRVAVVVGQCSAGAGVLMWQWRGRSLSLGGVTLLAGAYVTVVWTWGPFGVVAPVVGCLRGSGEGGRCRLAVVRAVGAVW